MTFPKPTVVLSQCLGADACRYNAESIRDDFVRKLAPFVTFRPVCPEVEIGLGIPRDPVRLVLAGETIKLVQPDTARDHTSSMKRFAAAHLEGLPPVDGFILKGRSPTCGVFDAKVYPTMKKGPSTGRRPGIFAEAVLERFPGSAIEDEGRLKNFRIREHFLTRLFLNARFRAARSQGSMGDLVRFQATHKLLLMVYNQKELRELGRVVGNQEKRSLESLWKIYETHLHRALAKLPRFTSNINVLMHALGYFSRELRPKEKAYFLDLLEQYRGGKIPISAAISVVRSWIHRYENPYLAEQVFFEPYPLPLVEITDSGKGRGRL